MGRKNSQNTKNELDELIYKYESAKAEEKQIYLDGDQFADIATGMRKSCVLRTRRKLSTTGSGYIREIQVY